MGQGKIVTVASQKGGVGKTTVALNVGLALARRMWRTLVIDTDPQGGLGLSLGASVDERPGLVEVLGGAVDPDEAVVSTRVPGLELLPLGQLRAIDEGRWMASLEDGRHLEKLFADLRARADVVLVDTPSGLGGVTAGALRASDFALIQAAPLAGRPVRRILELLVELRKEGAEIQLAGFVLNMLQSRRQASLDVAQESWRMFPDNVVMETSVPRDTCFLDASAATVPVAMLRRLPPPIAAIFDRLAAELEPKIGLEVPDNEAVLCLVD